MADVKKGGDAAQGGQDAGLPQGGATALNNEAAAADQANAQTQMNDAVDAGIAKGQGHMGQPDPMQDPNYQPDGYQMQPVELHDPASDEQDSAAPPADQKVDFLTGPSQRPQQSILSGHGLSAPQPPGNVQDWLPAFAEAAADPKAAPFIKGLYAAILDQLNRGQ